MEFAGQSFEPEASQRGAEQYPLPIDLGPFEDRNALVLHELAEYYQIEPERLVIYAIALLNVQRLKEEESGQVYHPVLASEDGQDEYRLPSVRDAANLGIM